jgi:hypothetical protein
LKLETIMRKRFLLIPAALVAAACNVDQPAGVPGPIDSGMPSAVIPNGASASTVVESAIAGGWEPITIDVHLNFITRQSAWTSNGAFVDSGSIDFPGSVAILSQGRFEDIRKLEQVVSPIIASDGSTITWTFAKTFTFVGGTTWVSKAQWHMVEGTGQFAGITGHGDLVGDLDEVTGELHDVFTGWVRLR